MTAVLLANSENPFAEPYGPVDWVCIGCCAIVFGAVALRLGYLIVKGEFL